ncbi:MAG: hypothetical protein QF844_11745, partial [Acidimicrobiales bacterium]|nr:hypothetical protein [Acidimicrobiales bacterium]
ASAMYGGAPTAYVQITAGDGGVQDAVCAARGVEAVPTTQLWQAGELAATVSAYALEDALLDLGARWAGGGGARTARWRWRGEPADSDGDDGCGDACGDDGSGDVDADGRCGGRGCGRGGGRGLGVQRGLCGRAERPP